LPQSEKDLAQAFFTLGCDKSLILERIMLFILYCYYY